MKKLKAWLENFAEGWREGRALRKARKIEALYVTECDNGHFFNALRQSGVCPHPPAGIYLAGDIYKETENFWGKEEIH